MKDPFHIQWVDNSPKCVLLFVAAYGMGIGIYLSTKRNYRPGEEHGSARWGGAAAVDKKYRDKNPQKNKILTQNVRIGLDGRMFVFFGFQMVYGTLFLALGKAKEGGILSISRQGIFFIPVILILPHVIGLNGVIYSQAIADLLTVILTAVLAVKLKKELKGIAEQTA